MPIAPVQPDKEAKLLARMTQLGIWEQDLIEKFIRGSGPGGQKKNKTSSAVYLKHTPTGIEVRCQLSRSQSLNRFLARRELCDRIQQRFTGEKSKRQQEAEKIRRQKRRRSRKQKEKMLAKKHQVSEKKKLRRRVGLED